MGMAKWKRKRGSRCFPPLFLFFWKGRREVKVLQSGADRSGLGMMADLPRCGLGPWGFREPGARRQSRLPTPPPRGNDLFLQPSTTAAASIDSTSPVAGKQHRHVPAQLSNHWAVPPISTSGGTDPSPGCPQSTARCPPSSSSAGGDEGGGWALSRLRGGWNRCWPLPSRARCADVADRNTRTVAATSAAWRRAVPFAMLPQVLANR